MEVGEAGKDVASSLLFSFPKSEVPRRRLHVSYLWTNAQGEIDHDFFPFLPIALLSFPVYFALSCLSMHPRSIKQLLVVLGRPEDLDAIVPQGFSSAPCLRRCYCCNYSQMTMNHCKNVHESRRRRGGGGAAPKSPFAGIGQPRVSPEVAAADLKKKADSLKSVDFDIDEDLFGDAGEVPVFLCCVAFFSFVVLWSCISSFPDARRDASLGTPVMDGLYVIILANMDKLYSDSLKRAASHSAQGENTPPTFLDSSCPTAENGTNSVRHLPKIEFHARTFLRPR